jgi:two-component system, cell cycle sensor histidine kinase and response regulator CckA
MNKEKCQPTEANDLSTSLGFTWRERAEEKARKLFMQSSEKLEALTPERTRPLLYELRVHQIELEMQNEELRRAQSELEGARARYFDLYDLAPIGYLTINEKGLILEVNLAAANLLGVARSALIKRPLSRFVLRQEQDAFYRHRKEIFETGQSRACELEMAREDGTQFWARLETNAARDAESAPVCHVAISDITESKRVFQELQAQLLQAHKMEVVGQLAGGIAHDFNNILAAIMMQLDLLRLQPNVAPDALRQTAGELLDAANRAANLIRQLLLFSSGHPMKASRHDANVIIFDLLKMLERLLGEQVTLVFERCEEPLWVEADVSMIEQVIMNLCVNARDAMPTGGRLTVATGAVVINAEEAGHHREAQPGPFVYLRVSDTGSGMQPSTLEHIFEPFYTTKAQGKGTGLGLATVEGIIAKHGGFVEVESQVGKGTTFNVYLPRIESRPISVRPRSSVPPPAGNESILVVEDDTTVRRIAVISLRFLGYRVTEAVNGVEALKIWEQESGDFDLLFSDMVMPGGISGLDLFSRLKKINPNLKIVITSGYSAETMYDANVTGQEVTYLRKPYKVTNLAAAIRSCLDKKARPEPLQV